MEHGICTSLYKIGNVGHQQRELRFLLGIRGAEAPVWNEEPRLSIPVGSQQALQPHPMWLGPLPVCLATIKAR